MRSNQKQCGVMRDRVSVDSHSFFVVQTVKLHASLRNFSFLEYHALDAMYKKHMENRLRQWTSKVAATRPIRLEVGRAR